MKVAMHLAEPVGTAFQPPPPTHQLALDVSQDLGVHTVELAGIRVENAHDAFVMTDQLACPANVEGRIGSGHSVNLDEIVTNRINAREIAIIQIPSVSKLLEVLVVALAMHELVEDEEFLELAN